MEKIRDLDECVETEKARATSLREVSSHCKAYTAIVYMIQDFKCMLMVDIQLRKFIVVIVYSRN